MFLEAKSGEIPELKRVIVVYGDRIVMERNLELSLDKLFDRDSALAKASQPVPPDIGAQRGGAEPTSTRLSPELARRAWQHLQQAKEQMPDDGSAADTLGWVLLKRGVPSAAIGYLQEATERFPADAFEI